MSGGHYEYENHKIGTWADLTEEYHKEFADFLRKVDDLVHKMDYAICADCSMEDFEREWSIFKEEMKNGKKHR